MMQRALGFLTSFVLERQIPEALALAELKMDEDARRWEPVLAPSPIQSVDLFESEDGRRLVLNCETSTLTLETSFETREIRVDYKE